MIRDFRPEDYGEVKALHESSGDDYQLPALTYKDGETERKHPLFISAKVLVNSKGKILVFMGGRIQMEMYMLADKSPWAHPKRKMECIQVLDSAIRREAYLQGVDDAVAYIPPTKKRFVKRVKDYLGYRPPRENWTPLSRPTKETR